MNDDEQTIARHAAARTRTMYFQQVVPISIFRNGVRELGAVAVGGACGASDVSRLSRAEAIVCSGSRDGVLPQGNDEGSPRGTGAERRDVSIGIHLGFFDQPIDPEIVRITRGRDGSVVNSERTASRGD